VIVLLRAAWLGLVLLLIGYLVARGAAIAWRE
jgi:hypothetical protein